MSKKANNKTEAKPKFLKRFIRLLWLLIALPFILIYLGVLFASMGWFGAMPSIEDIQSPQNNLATEVISSDGQILGKYYLENRTPVIFEEISPYMVEALVCTEDERYWQHSGVDGRSLSRAILSKMIGKNAGGGSTITQQLAKMLFTKEYRGKNKFTRILQKFKEWVIAARLEKNYTKKEIIAMYLNRFDFLYQAVGIKSAAEIYFKKLPKDLDIQESAVLVGMAKNPSLYNPKKNPKNALKRRNTVYGQLLRNNKINKEEFDKLKEEPLKLDYHKESHVTGISTYFREFLRLHMKEWLKEHKKPNGDKYNLYSDGLKIYTTIDYRLQVLAEKAVAKHHDYIQRLFYKRQSKRSKAPFPWKYSKKDIEKNIKRAIKQTERYRLMKKAKKTQEEIDKAFDTKVAMKLYTVDGLVDTTLSPRDSVIHMKYILHHAMMSMDPTNGHIKTWVGGIDYRYFKFDNVYSMKRQIGSTFKPFVYAAAIDQHNYSPCDEIPDALVTFKKENWNLQEDWTPKNSTGKYGGTRTLTNALANSVNTITAYLMKKVGPKKVKDLARKMGVTSHIPEMPSIALGTPDITMYEMVGAYGTFANKGVYTKPVFIERIEDKNGTIIYQNEPETRAVLSEEKAYVMLKLMQGVTEYGTSVRLKRQYKLKNPIAGKTGTTQDNRDGWFIGIVPNLVTGVWTGAYDPAVRFPTTHYGQGARTALPIYGEFLSEVYKNPGLGISDEDFQRFGGRQTIVVDCEKEIEQKSGSETYNEKTEF